MKTNLSPYLLEHPFIKGMNPKHIETIVGCASNVKFDAGEYLFREGDEATEFYFIRHGQLALELYRPQKGAIVVQTLNPGEVQGWAWIFPPHYRNLDCRATELTRAIALDGTCLREKCEEDHELGYELMKRFSHVMEQELESLRLRILDVYGNNNS